MAEQLPIHVYQEGDVIFREGDSPSGLFVIRRGKVKITKGDQLLDELGKNEFFGEMALVDNRPRSATATAVQHTECIRITSVDFQKRVMKLDPMMQGVFRVLVKRMRIMNEKLSEQE